MTRHPASSHHAARGERGTAFIIVLLALVVLTIFGIALSFVTQSELQIGVNERYANRAFYMADSGVGVATARVLVSGDRAPLVHDFNANVLSSSASVVDRLDMSAFVPLLDSPCPLCQINNSTSYNQPYRQIDNLLNSTGSRVGIGPGGENVLAQHGVSVTMGLSPILLDQSAFPALEQKNIARLVK